MVITLDTVWPGICSVQNRFRLCLVIIKVKYLSPTYLAILNYSQLCWQDWLKEENINNKYIFILNFLIFDSEGS